MTLNEEWLQLISDNGEFPNPDIRHLEEIETDRLWKLRDILLIELESRQDRFLEG